MAYRFTEKTNSKQQQTAYALYKVISGYFHKSICKTKTTETTLLLYYRELQEERQKRLEREVEACVQEELQDVRPVLLGMNCEVLIRRRKGNYHLDFKTGFESISVVVEPDGNYRIANL